MSVTLKLSHPDGESGLLKIGSEFVLRVVYMIGEWNINEPIEISRHFVSPQESSRHLTYQTFTYQPALDEPISSYVGPTRT